MHLSSVNSTHDTCILIVEYLTIHFSNILFYYLSHVCVIIISTVYSAYDGAIQEVSNN